MNPYAPAIAHITTLEIEGLRGFADCQALELALPNGELGSGITALVGPNNAGKSTIIEAFRVLNSTADGPPSFTEGKRNRRAGDRVRIRMVNQTGAYKELRTVEAGGSETVWLYPDIPPFPKDIFVLPSRRTFAPYFSRGIADRAAYMISYGAPAIRGSSIDNFSHRLFTSQKNRAAFDEVLARVLNPVPDWTIEQADSGQYYLKMQYGDLFHTSDGLGEGLVSIFFIVDALYDSEPGQVIVIDEPELSLHPALQKKLFVLLAQYACDRQIVYSTHSPYFINWEAIFNGGKVVRVHKIGHNSILSALSLDSVKGLQKLSRDLNNPHVLGLDASEVLFLEDGVVLVEGQEDVVIYRGIAKQVGRAIRGDFYGWGVGGAEKMRAIATILREIGFSRVVGILDSDKASLHSRLAKEFPDYRFFMIPAPDVRDKDSRKELPKKDGLTGTGGTLYPQYQGAMERLIDSLNAVLDGTASTPAANGNATPNAEQRSK